MSKKKAINVLMVTGVYSPELNGAVLQCKRVVSLLKNKIIFSILTTTRHKTLAGQSIVNGVDVFRPYVGNRIAKLLQIIKIFQVLLTRKIDIVHLHGFSSRSALILLVSKLFNKKIIIKMTSFGHDDPISIQNNSKLLYYIFSLADIYIGVSPIFKDMYFRTRLNKNKYYQIPNGVDIDTFLPLRSLNEKDNIRHELGLPIDIKIILVVGHFSIEKSANHILEAWLKIKQKLNTKLGIVFIGSTNAKNFEVDDNLVKSIQSRCEQFIGEEVFFVEKTNHIEQYYQVADVYVLSSAREGMPNTLLEAMSCALPVISTRLKGITDWALNHNVNGMMYDYGDIDALGILLENLLQDDNLCKRIGSNARTTIKDNFNVLSTAERIHHIYEDL